jgi:hypothetical protein
MSLKSDNLMNRTLEEVENDYWKDTFFPTNLVKKCFYIRKKKLRDLMPEDLRILVSQKMSLKYTVPLSIQVLNKDLMIDSGFYPGDLLEAVLKVSPDFWREEGNKKLAVELTDIIALKFENIVSSDVTEQIKNDIVKAYSTFKENI